MKAIIVGAVLPALYGLVALSLVEETNAQQREASRTLEEIVVTARRRDENLQQVPISIEALGGEEMELRGMERIENVIAQTPNVMTTNFGPAGASNFSMRGIPNIGIFVDGIWQQSSILLNERSTVELERIEILRGPQGTLYGRDTTGGAIRLVTKRPQDDFGVRVTGTTGSYERLDLTLAADFPITETFLTRFTMSRQQRDGYVQSLSVDRAYGEIDNKLLRGDFVWTPTDRLDFRLILEDSLQQTSGPNGAILVMDPGPPGPSPGFGAVVPPRQYYELLGFQFDNESHAAGWPGGQVGEWETKSDFNEGHGIVVDSEAVTFNIEYKFSENLTLTSLTGWREQESRRYSDFDSSEFEMFAQQQWAKGEWFTEELQLAGAMGRFDWVVGGFIFDTESLDRQIRWGQVDLGPDEAAIITAAPECNIAPPPGIRPGCRVPGFPNTDPFTGTGEEGWALFGEVTIGLSDTLSLTLGARHHYQENPTWTEIYAPGTPRLAEIVVPGRVLPGDYFGSLGRENEQSVDFDANTYRFALSNQFTDDIMAYIGFSEGFNSGDIERVTVLDGMGNPVQLDFPLDPEQIKNYEVGVRSDWLGGSLRVNATVFYTEWLDLQQRLQINNPFTGELIPQGIDQNVAEAEAKGAEITIKSMPTEQLSFDLGVGILDTEYTNVDEGVTSVQIGDKFGLAPELQYNIGAQWSDEIATGGNLLFRLDYTYTDDYIRSYAPDTQIQFNNPGVEFDQKGFGLLSARVSYTSQSGKWEVAAFGTNLTDEFYLSGGFNPGILAIDFGGFGRPREAGLTFRFFLE